MTIPRLTAVVACVFMAVASSANAQAMGQTIKGISCDAQEGQRIHIHQHLTVVDHGTPILIPRYIGIPSSRCIYWLHTHTPDGIIHIEAPRDRSFTLGDFFAVWGQPITRRRVASAETKRADSTRVWVNGALYAGNPAKIPLTAHADIVIQVGPPFTKPAAFTSWGAL